MTATVRQVPLAQIHPDPDQPRKGFGKLALQVLADNLKARGVQQPLLVLKVGKKLVIKDGERRWRAAKLAKLKTVPVIEIGSEDTVQTRLDQVAVNNLREPLQPMDFARLVASLRTEHKLTDNDIAARLDKDGIPWPGKKHLADIVRLVDLPDWAQAMIDAGEMDTSAAKPLVAALADKDVVKAAASEIRRRVHWSGKVTERDVLVSVRKAYEETGPDLSRIENWQQNPVLFNPKIACKGCEHLRTVGGNMFCRNRKHFDELQAQAKQAGLLPGGKKPAAKTAAPATSPVAAELDERKEFSRQAKLAEYLTAWLRGHITVVVLGEDPERFLYAGALTDYMAAGMPDGPYAATSNPVMRDLHGRRRLADYMSKHLNDDELIELARAGVAALAVHQVRELAAYLKLNLDAIYRVDAGYLALKRKAELLKLAELGGVEDVKKVGAKELPDRILAAAGAVERIGVPPDLRAEFEKPVADRRDTAETPEGMVCVGCGCSDLDGCVEPCSWIREDPEAGQGVCSNCDHLAEAWDDGERHGGLEQEAA